MLFKIALVLFVAGGFFMLVKMINRVRRRRDIVEERELNAMVKDNIIEQDLADTVLKGNF